MMEKYKNVWTLSRDTDMLHRTCRYSMRKVRWYAHPWPFKLVSLWRLSPQTIF